MKDISAIRTFLRDILGDIEGRISRARAELNGETPQLVLPSLEGLPEPDKAADPDDVEETVDWTKQ